MASTQRPCPRCQAPLDIPQPAPASLQCAKCGASIKLKAASSEAIQAPPKPSAPARPSDDKPAPVSIAHARKPWLVLVGAGLAASLCLCSGGMFLVLGVLGNSTKPAEKKPGEVVGETDTPIIKVKEPPKEGALDFGPSVLANYESRTLDALDPKKIPPLEQYPWQPKELVAVLGQHRLFGGPAAISPDASLIAVRDAGNPHKATVLIGDSTKLHVQTVLTIPAVTAMAFSPDNKTLATIGSADKTVRLWDVQTGKEIGKLGPHVDALRHVTFVDNQRVLASADKTLFVWDVEKRKVIHELTGHEGTITSMAASRDGKKAVSAGNDVEWAVRLWDLDTGKQISVLRPERYSRQTDAEIATNVVLSEDGLQVAIAGFFKDTNLLIKTFNTAQLVPGKETQTIPCMRVPPCFAFSPDGLLLLTELAFGPLQLWDLSSGKPVGKVGPGKKIGGGGKLTRVGRFGIQGAAAVAFKTDPGGRKIVSAGYEVHVFDEATGLEAAPITGHSNPIYRLELSPDGRHVGSTGSNAVCYWRLDTALERHRVPYGYGTSVLAVGFTPDCAKMFYGASPPVFLDMEYGQKVKPALPPEAKRGYVHSAAVTPDGHFAAASFSFGAIPLWDLRTAQEVRQFQARDRKPGVDRALIEFSPDGRRMLTYYIDRRVPVTTLWDIDYTNELHTWNNRAFFLPTGRVLVLEGTSATEYAVDDETPRETGKLPLNTVGLQDFALSKDGKRLAGIVTKEGGVRVLSVDSGATVWHWRPPHFSARVVHLSPNGRYLFAGNSNGTIYVYRLPL